MSLVSVKREKILKNSFSSKVIDSEQKFHLKIPETKLSIFLTKENF